MSDCIFCKIVSGEIPSTKVYEDDKILAFRDLNPQADVHILIIPKEHIMDSSADVNADNKAIIADVFEVAAKIAKSEGLDDGFRIVTNSGKNGKQSVNHIHFHLIGGNELSGNMA